MLAIRDYEQQLSHHFLTHMRNVDGLKLYGIPHTDRLDERVPTFAITLPDATPHQLSTALAERGFATWAGHYYALALVERLGRLDAGGMLRIGCAHYNTTAELDALLDALQELGTSTL
jgi:selenocysteine lyase/cysteine desulfurase